MVWPDGQETWKENGWKISNKKIKGIGIFMYFSRYIKKIYMCAICHNVKIGVIPLTTTFRNLLAKSVLSIAINLGFACLKVLLQKAEMIHQETQQCYIDLRVKTPA